MTHSEPVPAEGDPLTDPDLELRAVLEAEILEDIEFGEHDRKTRRREDTMALLLLQDDFPFLAQAMEIRSQIGIDSGLTELYDHFKSRADKFRDQIASNTDPSTDLLRDYQLSYLLSVLILTLQLLAAAKGAQESALETARTIEATGNIALAARCREFAYETRKEAEAKVLMDELLGEKTAARILLVVGSEFEGESLVPLTEKSQNYLMMYRLKQEKKDNDRTDLNAYVTMAQELLISRISSGQREHPSYEDFSFSLSCAIARSVVAPRYNLGFSHEQLRGYETLVSAHVADAVKRASQIGLTPSDVISIYRDIISKLS